MDYKVAGAADTTMLHKPGLVSAADGQSRDQPPSDTNDLETFGEAISRQAAARAARYAIGSRAISEGIQHGHRDIERKERLSLGRSLNLMLVFALGVAVYAAIIYFTLGRHLHSPVPSPNATLALMTLARQPAPQRA